MSGLIGGSSSKGLRVKEFRSSGTFPVPSGVKTVSLFLVGGGAGSDGNDSGTGGNVIRINYDVDGKASCAVLIGSGGVSGGHGGDTVFDGVVVAKGGTANSGGTMTAGYFQQVESAGRDGFGGIGGIGAGRFVGMNGAGNPRPGRYDGVPSTGGGGAAGGSVGGSGYLRVEWYE